MCSETCQRLIGADGSARTTNPAQARNKLVQLSRQLWQEHVAWTREVIVKSVDWFRGGSKKGGTDDKARLTAVRRLLRNQDEIGVLVGTMLGNEDAGRRLAGLLREHITGAAVILQAARDDGASLTKAQAVLGTDPKVRPEIPTASGSQLLEAIRVWYENGKTIVGFLDTVKDKTGASVLPATVIQPEFNAHLWQTIVEAVQYLGKDYAGSAKTTDDAVEHILLISDVIVEGLMSLILSRADEKKTMKNFIAAVGDAETGVADIRKRSTEAVEISVEAGF